MAYVVTRLCIDCLDRGCTDECPVECIYEPRGEATPDRPKMAYIHPVECINCGACEPACPWGAIFEDRELPAEYADDVALNAQVESDPKGFVVSRHQRDSEGRLLIKPKPDKHAAAQNAAKWKK